MSLATASLNVLRIDPTIRAKVAETLLPGKDMKVSAFLIYHSHYEISYEHGGTVGHPVHFTLCRAPSRHLSPTPETLRSSCRYAASTSSISLASLTTSNHTDRLTPARKHRIRLRSLLDFGLIILVTDLSTQIQCERVLARLCLVYEQSLNIERYNSLGRSCRTTLSINGAQRQDGTITLRGTCGRHS